MPTYVLAIDQGTTSSRAILFREDLTVAASAQKEFAQHFPASGWVEHEPEDLWSDGRRGLPTRSWTKVGRQRRRHRGDRHHQPARDDPRLGQGDGQGDPSRHRLAGPAHRRHLRRHEGRRPGGDRRRRRPGLLLDPYFSGTKVAWILDHVPGARARAEAGELAFGTVDTFLLWRLTGGKVHATDATNAARTLLFDIHEGRWRDTLLHLFRVPRAMLPEVHRFVGRVRHHRAGPVRRRRSRSAA